MTLPDAGDLRRLLDDLSLEPRYTVSLERIDIIRHQDPDEPLPDILVETIERLRRIVYRSRDFQQLGLFEFDLGLLCLEGRRYRDAANQFERAWRQWRFMDVLPPLWLAKFAQGVALHWASDYEGAFDSYLDVKRYLDGAAAVRTPGLAYRAEDLQEFATYINQYLDDAVAALQDNFRPESQTQRHYLATVEPPIISDRLTAGGQLPQPMNQLNLQFGISRRLVRGDFVSKILPAIDAVGRINRAIAYLSGKGEVQELTIDDVSLEASLEIVLGGLIPQTGDACEYLFTDVAYRNGLDKMMADLQGRLEELNVSDTALLEAHEDSRDHTRRSELEMAVKRLEQELASLEQRQAGDLVERYMLVELSYERREAVKSEIAGALRLLREPLFVGSLTLLTHART